MHRFILIKPIATRHNLLALRVAIWIYLLFSSKWLPSALAAVFVEGSDQSRSLFVGMLNTYALPQGAWHIHGGGALELHGTPKNYFTFEVNRIVTETFGAGPLDIHLRVGRRLPGILFGSPLVISGKHVVDLDDILRFPVFHPLLDLQASWLMHEIEEAWWFSAGNGFRFAHNAAIVLGQNFVLDDLGSRGNRLLGPEQFRRGPGGTLEILIPWINKATSARLFEVLRVRAVGASIDITDIFPGGVDTGSSSGSDLDIEIESVYSEMIPEPSTLILFNVGVIVFVSYRGLRRNRRRLYTLRARRATEAPPRVYAGG